MKKEKNNKRIEISKKMNFSEILEKFPDSVDVLFESGMRCIGCPMAMQESLEDGAISHGLNPDTLVKKLNKKLGKK